jgi:glucose-6-phosphate-specific signal transduction histidine kinase
MNHGFGLKNIRDASETYGGELSLSCEERSHVCKFRTEIIFNLPDEVTSDAPNL